MKLNILGIFDANFIEFTIILYLTNKPKIFILLNI